MSNGPVPFDYAFTGAAGTMVGVDGWAWDSDQSSYSLNRDGTGSLTYTTAGGLDDFSGAIRHAIDPFPAGDTWRLKLYGVCPTTPFQNLFLQVGIQDAGNTALVLLSIQGSNDGTPPNVVVTDTNGNSTSAPVNPGWDTATVWEAYFDGSAMHILQDGVELTSTFPWSPAVFTADHVFVFWKSDRTDLPAARLTRVTVSSV
jgi:hypothetical protein